METKRNITISDIYPIIEKTLCESGHVQLTVQGKSMTPTLKDGETVVSLISVEKADNLALGDIILFQRQNGKYVLHRIVGRNDKTWIICGDSQIQYEYISDDLMIKAVVEGYYRNNHLINRSSFLFKLDFIVVKIIRFYKKAINYIKRRFALKKQDK